MTGLGEKKHLRLSEKQTESSAASDQCRSHLHCQALNVVDLNQRTQRTMKKVFMYTTNHILVISNMHNPCENKSFPVSMQGELHFWIQRLIVFAS